MIFRKLRWMESWKLVIAWFPEGFFYGSPHSTSTSINHSARRSHTRSSLMVDVSRTTFQRNVNHYFRARIFRKWWAPLCFHTSWVRVLVNKIIYKLHNFEEYKFFWSIKVTRSQMLGMLDETRSQNSISILYRTDRLRNSDSARKEILPKDGRNTWRSHGFAWFIPAMVLWYEDRLIRNILSGSVTGLLLSWGWNRASSFPITSFPVWISTEAL